MRNVRVPLVLAVVALLTTTTPTASQPPFSLTSTAFTHQASLPPAYTGYGEFRSPPLAWSGAPAKTREFALVVEDEDVPLASFAVHWLVYDIPATVSRLPETPKPADPKTRPAPLPTVRQGVNALKHLGYLPPRPMAGSGLHRYTFTIYALSADLTLADGLTNAQVMAAIKPYIIGQAQIVATVESPGA